MPTSFGPPCRTEPREDLPDRLVAAIYVLLRDHVHPGDFEQAAMHLAGAAPECRNTTFTNPHLEALARAYASFLLDGGVTYPYQDGDVLVIGPECFVSQGAYTEDNPVISYRGRNFVIPGSSGPMRAQGWKDAIEYLRAEQARRVSSPAHTEGIGFQDGWAEAVASLERLAGSSDDSLPKGSANCPRCGSPDPKRHPATSFEGEVQPCLHPWHGPGDRATFIPADDRPEGEEIHFIKPESATWDPSTDGQTITMMGGETVRISTDTDRTPPKIVAASGDEAAHSLAAFIAQELEHWGFTIEMLSDVLPDDPPHTRFKVVAENTALTVTVDEH